RTDAPPPEGSRLRLRLRLPGSARLLELSGRVAWVLRADAAAPHAPGMGIEFIDRAAIAELARELEALAAAGQLPPRASRSPVRRPAAPRASGAGAGRPELRQDLARGGVAVRRVLLHAAHDDPAQELGNPRVALAGIGRRRVDVVVREVAVAEG